MFLTVTCWLFELKVCSDHNNDCIHGQVPNFFLDRLYVLLYLNYAIFYEAI